MDKVDKEDKSVENWTRESWIPIDFVKSWNYFENYGHKIRGMVILIQKNQSGTLGWLKLWYAGLVISEKEVGV